MTEKLNVFWLRRDLRLHDNVGLHHVLHSLRPVLLLFIFDTDILESLDTSDARVTLIHKQLESINDKLKNYQSSLLVEKGKPLEVWEKLIEDYQIEEVYTNEDYEPYAIKRDKEIEALLTEKNISFSRYTDHTIFHPSDVLKDDGKPYTVYTPFSRKWKLKLKKEHSQEYTLKLNNLWKGNFDFPELSEMGFEKSSVKLIPINKKLSNYKMKRDIPSVLGTSNLSPYLRFGMVSIREIVRESLDKETFLNELIWREFFIQIMYHFPESMTENFKRKYDVIQWRNDEDEFQKWCDGQTGYPIVDAGMRQLNETGYMHNRVRMVVASFLCKHLLIDWKWGETYFASKLLDYEMASNVGNWQWAASTGCDSVPYFRIFNPDSQQKKFDPEWKYIRKWVKEVDLPTYPQPIVEHRFARERALETYKNVSSI